MPRNSRNGGRGGRTANRNSNNRRGNQRRRQEQDLSNVREGELTLVAKGTLRDISRNFPISFNESKNGVPYINGAKLEVQKIVMIDGQEKLITKSISVVAFDEIAEDLQDVCDGCWVEVTGDLSKYEGSDGNWYDQLIVRNVENIEFPDED